MRRLLSAIFIGFTITFLAGCSTTESDYDLGRTVIAESPTIRRQVQVECTAEMRSESSANKEVLAAHMKVPVSKFADTLCRRVLNAMANGRLTYADFKTLRTEKTKAKVLRVIKGKVVSK